MKKRSYHISVVNFEFDMAELPFGPIFVSLTQGFLYDLGVQKNSYKQCNIIFIAQYLPLYRWENDEYLIIG